jgi:hypothetical protein
MLSMAAEFLVWHGLHECQANGVLRYVMIAGL